MVRIAHGLGTAFLLAAAGVAHGQAPAPATGVTARDHPWDNGSQMIVSWALSVDDETLVQSYEISKALARVGGTDVAPEFELVEAVDAGTDEHVVPDLAREIKLDEIENRFADLFDVEAMREAGEHALPVEYYFQVVAVGKDGSRSMATRTVQPGVGTMEWFDGQRIWFMVTVVIFCGSVFMFIQMARGGKPLRVRKIAGLEAVDEAVGRATEMGRSCLFIPGIQDMNDIQTIAGINILARVARTAAKYDAKVEVPTARSLVMTTARETVHGAFLEAGRPDAYNEDLIYYVTDEQFGFVAYLQGMMVREKPAACFYMGSFYAESLILAETGNGIGAIQVAGTAQPAQLPFFVAACDYTLIGEEFFAASAYLTGSPEELGSLKGQDVGKLIVAAGLLAGVAASTIASIARMGAGDWIYDAVQFFKQTMLT